MKFEYKKETNLEIGQKLYGIVSYTRYTYGGVYPITVCDIDFRNDEVIFEINQPCRFVACGFYDMEDLVFETKEEAEHNEELMHVGMGLYACDW